MKRIIILIIMLLSLCGCKIYKPVVVPGEMQHDTIYQHDVRYDSIKITDSVVTYIEIKGDTTIIEHDRLHTEYRDRYLHDSIYISKCDTINTVIHDTTNIVTGWQWVQIWLGRILAAILLIASIVLLIKSKI